MKASKKGNNTQTLTTWAEGIKPAVVTVLASNMDRWPQTGVGLEQPWCWVAKYGVLNKTDKSHTKHKCIQL
jgi:hypothetical protein